jgi:hypothetical protein
MNLVKTVAPAKPARPSDGIASDASVGTDQRKAVGTMNVVMTVAPAKPARPSDGIASDASVFELEPINGRPLGL